jgi:hypothetical protein
MKSYGLIAESYFDKNNKILFTPYIYIESKSIDNLKYSIDIGDIKEFNGFEIIDNSVISDNELRVEFLMPFDLSYAYYFIEESEIKRRMI